MILETHDHRNRQWQTVGWTGEPFGPPRLAGGRLCLDFANTVGGRGTEHLSEFLTGYHVLVAWAWYAGALSDEEAMGLRRVAGRRRNEAALAHRRAIAFRDLIYRLFLAVARNEEPLIADVDELNRLYRVVLDHARIRPQGAHFEWEWIDANDELDRPLWAVVWSAVNLLISQDLDRIKVCPGGDGSSCQWLFFDDTKNRIRRWCSMENCGSSAKARRQTARRQAARHVREQA
jgi:predicted RNA-binding Zn ribbon-like protein